MDYRKEFILRFLLSNVLRAYNGNGNVIEDYYKNVILPELTLEELAWLIEAANGKF